MERNEGVLAGAVTAKTAILDEERLIEEAQASSEEAWARIYDEHYVKMFNYCYIRTGNPAVAEDLASDVFLEALRGIHRYRYRGAPISAWLYRIAHNITADFLRGRKRRPTVPLEDEFPYSQLQSADGADGSAIRLDLDVAIRQLTDDQQQVILLRFFQGLSHEEAAAVMQRSPGAVRVLQNRALSSLRRVMAAR
jgi:RNA polymerase sigma-70 factor (ECF subfamily)